MGSYATFKIKDYEIFWMKSYVDSSIMSLFIENDRKESVENEPGNPEYEYKNIIYQSDAITIKTRLNILGFNLESLKFHFENTKKYRLENFSTEDKDIDEKEFLDSFTFDKYLSALNEIYDKKIDFFGNGNSLNYEEIEKIKNSNPYIKYILEEVEYPDNRVDIDYRLYLRGFLEKIDDNTNIFVDLSQLIDAGYYNENDKIAEQSLNKQDRTIIFTEGKYDTNVIKKSMELLYPQYSKYFSFLDIELSNLELGANRVITYLKSFISAGIMNRVVVLFDNDAEGVYCKNELLKLKDVSSNFCIKTYPDIIIAKSYPTICPNGIEKLNINGSACSIELYLCDESLKEKNNYIPIQWKSFNEHIQKYQGVISKKADIQKKYETTLIDCNTNKENIKKYNFENMKILLEDIFTSFNDSVL